MVPLFQIKMIERGVLDDREGDSECVDWADTNIKYIFEKCKFVKIIRYGCGVTGRDYLELKELGLEEKKVIIDYSDYTSHKLGIFRESHSFRIKKPPSILFIHLK